MARRWALLCGGDFYLPPKPKGGGADEIRPPKNLSGCVRDVTVMRDVLIKSGLGQADIRMLTATVGSSPDKPVEPEDRWPTWKNIERELKRIMAEAEQGGRGGLVYFHYSGHGTRRRDIDWDEENEEGQVQNGTALVMTDVFQGGAYLTGRHLGIWVKKMVQDLDLRVTVVLDSCHSGGGFRYGDLADDDGVDRTIDGPPTREVDLAADRACGDEDPDATRDPRGAKACWLTHPKGCAVVTACAAEQMAKERKFAGYSQGVLSYWLCAFLAKHSGPARPSHARAVDLVRQKIQQRAQQRAMQQQRWSGDPVQSPRVWGDGLFEFFGDTEYVRRATYSAAYDGDGEITLDVGEYQGVAVGAIYDIVADEVMSSAQPSLLSPSPLRAEVTSVKGFQSKAKPLLGAGGEQQLRDWPRAEIRNASLHQWALRHPVAVSFPSLQGPQRDRLRAELEKTPRLGLLGPQEEPSKEDLVVAVDCENTYEIRQGGDRLPRLPKISVEDESWAEKLARVLSQVARYQALKRQYTSADPCQKLPRSHFQLDVSPDRVKDGEQVSFSLDYTGHFTGPFWVSVFCLTASWSLVYMPRLAHELEVHFEDEPYDVQGVGMVIPPKTRDSDPDDAVDHFLFFVSRRRRNLTGVSWGDICLEPFRSKARPSAYEDKDRTDEDGDGSRNVSDGNSVPLLEAANVQWTVIDAPVRIVPRKQNERA